jgi:undecaprenyl-diphosphatase
VAAFDVRIFLYLHHAFAPFVIVAAVLSAIGGGWGALLILPIFASARHRFLARALTYVLVVNTVIVYGLKTLVARVRPCGCLPDVHALVYTTPTDYSFPSGHSAGSFCFAVFFAVLLTRERTPPRIAGAAALVVLALGVGLSRIALGVHYPGDVLAGAIIGSTIGGVGAVFYSRRAGVSAAAALP